MNLCNRFHAYPLSVRCNKIAPSILGNAPQRHKKPFPPTSKRHLLPLHFGEVNPSIYLNGCTSRTRGSQEERRGVSFCTNKVMHNGTCSPMIASGFHLGGKNLYTETPQVIFHLVFICISLIFVMDADENKLEFNLQGLRVGVFPTQTKSRGDHCCSLRPCAVQRERWVWTAGRRVEHAPI